MKLRISVMYACSIALSSMLSAQVIDSIPRQAIKLPDENAKVLADVVSDTTIIVPNVFTPNDDAYNNVFKITSSGKYFIIFKVFTRAGIMVYKTKAKTIEWDGRMDSGEKLTTGIYFYVVEMSESTPPVSKKGFFYIFE